MAARKEHNTPAPAPAPAPVGSPSSDDDTADTTTMLDNNSSSSSSSLKDQDRFLPIANVSRIMKKALPTNAKISKEAKESVQECVSEFISFITGEASDKCQREKRKTINGDDLLWAMTTLGFHNYLGPLKLYLNKYRETEDEKNCMARQGGGGGDQHYSPTTEDTTTTITHNNNNNHDIVISTDHHHQLYRPRQSIIHGHGDTNLPAFNGSFFSLGGAAAAAAIPSPSSFGDHQGRVGMVNYGDKSANNNNSTGFYMSAAAYDDGNKNNNVAAPPPNYHNGGGGVVWY